MCPKRELSSSTGELVFRKVGSFIFKGIKYWNVVCPYDRRESHKKDVNQMLADVTEIMI